MKVRCPSETCGNVFDFDPDGEKPQIVFHYAEAGGSHEFHEVRCPKCGRTFQVTPPRDTKGKP